MKALVIGGNRFFGKRLVARLLEQGAEITLLNRGGLDDGFGARVRRIVLDRGKLAPGVLGDQYWDVVYDQVCYDAREARGACAAFRDRVGHYIFTSSASVYDAGALIPESVFEPVHHDLSRLVTREEDYGEAKRQAEAVFFQEAAFPVSAVRFPIVLGTDDYTGRLAFHVDRVRDGRAIFLPNLDARISFVHSPDAAAFLAWLGGRAAVGPINCCAPEPIRLERLVQLLEQGVGRRANLTPAGEPSPFGAEADWYESAEKANALGFEAEAVERWLPKIITQLLVSR